MSRVKISNFKKFLFSLLALILISGLITAYFFYSRIYQPNVVMEYEKEDCVYIPTDATFEDVQQILIASGVVQNTSSFRWVAEQKNFIHNIKSGRFLLENGMNNNELVNLLRSGRQTPVNVVFNNVRTKEQFAGKVASQLELDSLALLLAMVDTAFTNPLDLDALTVSSIFIPNTYEFYWDVSVADFLARMTAEHHHFWTEHRKTKAQKLKLSQKDITTLASIVEKETIKKDEQPKVAGLYLNRLERGIKLESDPTVIFAIGDFTINRVLNKDLKIDSPYNTYKYKGLPPGPISIPSIQAIDAVLNHEKHDFIFMCAKDDFSGYHNFAKTYAGHLNNARKYRKALNQRGIKR